MQVICVFRKQYVKVGGNKSDAKNISCGVPQGSLIGPLLFLLYVNDMQNAVKHGSIRMYADDTNIFYFGKNSMEINAYIQSDMTNLEMWFKVNKLSININKCNFMKVQGKSINFELPEVNVKLCNTFLPQVNFCKYLGLYIDKNLLWKTRIENVCKKIAPVIGIIMRVKYYIPNDLLINIYYSLIHPHLIYCIESWGSAYKTYIEPLYILQKKIVRIILSAKKQDHTKPLFIELSILPIRKLYYMHVCQLVYKELNNLLPVKLGLLQTAEAHKYCTRQEKNLCLHCHRTNYCSRSILYICQI